MQVGVSEDPVTGSAHCALGPYWAAKLSEPELTAYQYVSLFSAPHPNAFVLG